MAKIVSIHSFRGGTGKSNTTANIAAILAQNNYRVGVIDTDIQSPGIHIIFGLNEDAIHYSLNDFLWGKCGIEQAAYDLTERAGLNSSGRLFLIPSSFKTGDIARMLHDGYDVNLLSEGFSQLIKSLKLDFLLIDTHPGLNEETLLSIALSDFLLIILRPDNQDYQGTGITVEVARQLETPKMELLVNKAPSLFPEADIRKRVEAAYNCPVAAIIPHSEDLMVLASGGIFSLKHPEHAVTRLYLAVAERIING
ncbi:MAG: MinD/ParA family protein [Elusimicrobiaceae bacterium]